MVPPKSNGTVRPVPNFQGIISHPPVVQSTLNVYVYDWREDWAIESCTTNIANIVNGVIGVHSHELARGWGEDSQGRGNH